MHILPADRQEIIANTPAAVHRVVRRVTRNQKAALGPMLIACGASGCHKRHVLAVAADLSIPVRRAHGTRTRFFAPISASMPRPLRSTPAALKELRKRLDDLKAMIRVEANRLEHACHLRWPLPRPISKPWIKNWPLLEIAIAQFIEGTSYILSPCQRGGLSLTWWPCV